MAETRMAPDNGSPSVSMLRLTAEQLKQIKFPQLVRPKVGPNAPPTIELIQWAVHAYSFPWIRHISALINGIVLLIRQRQQSRRPYHRAIFIRVLRPRLLREETS